MAHHEEQTVTACGCIEQQTNQKVAIRQTSGGEMVGRPVLQSALLSDAVRDCVIWRVDVDDHFLPYLAGRPCATGRQSDYFGVCHDSERGK